MNMLIFVAFVLGVGFTTWGRRLRERAFLGLSLEQRVQVADKMVNYTATETIPFSVLILSLVAIQLFKPAWLKAAFAIFLPILVLLITVLHMRTRHRFRQLRFPATFVSQYENSRMVSYSGLVAPVSVFALILYRWF